MTITFIAGRMFSMFTILVYQPNISTKNKGQLKQLIPQGAAVMMHF